LQSVQPAKSSTAVVHRIEIALAETLTLAKARGEPEAL
jgi:hypothetical protein